MTIEFINDNTRKRSYDKKRDCVEKHYSSHHKRGFCNVINEPTYGNILNPNPDLTNCKPRKEKPEIPILKCSEHRLDFIHKHSFCPDYTTKNKLTQRI